MTTAPFVELRFDPTGLRPGDLPRAGAFLGSPAEALEAALAVTRAAVVREVKEQLTGIGAPTQGQLLQIVDLAWRTAFWRYRKVSAPILADAYLRAYLAANAGDVPSSVIYNLADQHAEKVGEYFHATSREALAEGYNALVNRRVPARAAADRVMEAYGLSPRQMRGYNAATTFATPVTDQRPRPLKARAREYADKAFTSRVKKLAKQEEHNIDEQAKQFAWMWLQDKGRLNEKAQKLWITAKDERVCPVCGPLHGKKVGINERFRTKEGEFWTPGLHPNCRCVVRLIENRFSKNLAGTELKEFNELHPRAYDGRFGVKTRTKPQPKPQTKTIDVDEEFDRILATQVSVWWRYRGTDVDWAAAFGGAHQAVLDAFSGTYSYSLQQTLYAIGERVLAAVPAVCEVRLSLPNKHHYLVDLAPFGLRNDNEVYLPGDRPYGLIEGTVLADDAPPEGIAWS